MIFKSAHIAGENVWMSISDGKESSFHSPVAAQNSLVVRFDDSKRIEDSSSNQSNEESITLESRIEF